MIPSEKPLWRSNKSRVLNDIHCVASFFGLDLFPFFFLSLGVCTQRDAFSFYTVLYWQTLLSIDEKKSPGFRQGSLATKEKGEKSEPQEEEAPRFQGKSTHINMDLPFGHTPVHMQAKRTRWEECGMSRDPLTHERGGIYPGIRSSSLSKPGQHSCANSPEKAPYTALSREAFHELMAIS